MGVLVGSRFAPCWGFKAVAVIVSLAEIFSRAPPMLGFDLTHTGPLQAVSLVTSAGYDPPGSARGINFLCFLHAKL